MGEQLLIVLENLLKDWSTPTCVSQCDPDYPELGLVDERLVFVRVYNSKGSVLVKAELSCPHSLPELVIEIVVTTQKSLTTGRILRAFDEVIVEAARRLGKDCIKGYAEQNPHYTNGATAWLKLGYSLDWGSLGPEDDLTLLWEVFPQYAEEDPKDMPTAFWRQHAVGYPIVKRVFEL